jgi:hypothetical protein
VAIERTLVQIRERSFLDVLDLALVVVRRRPLTLGMVALAGIAPFEAFNEYLESRAGGEAGPLWILLVFLESALATAPLTVMLGGLMFGERPSAGRIARRIGSGLGPLLFYQGLARGLCIIITPLVFLIPARMAFLNEVILLERAGWRTAPARAADLGRDRGAELFSVWLVHLAFGLLFVVSFWWAIGKLTESLVMDLTWAEPPWGEVFNWRTKLATWLAVAFFGVVRFLTYIDQRIRLEGWEIELRLKSVGAAMEDGEQW